jgi:hypothetical protein
VEFLFDSESQNIANLVNNQLNSPYGEHIGTYLEEDNILVDTAGRYLGEIVQNNRLMYNVNYGSFNKADGYQDIETPWL